MPSTLHAPASRPDAPSAKAAPAPMWMAGDADAPSWVNDAWLAFTGRELDGALGSDWMATVHPEDLDARRHALMRALDGEAVRIACRMRHADGTYRHVIEEVALLDRDDGGPMLVASCLDVTSVRRERDALDGLLDAVPGVVWESVGRPGDAGEAMAYVSSSAQKELGYTREAWITTPAFWLSIVHPADRENALRRARQLYQASASGVNTFRWIARDGRILHVSAHTTPVLDAAGRVQGLRCVALDARGRVEAERAIREQAQLQQSLLDAQSDMGEGVIVCSRSRLHHVNEAFCKISGYALHELLHVAPLSLLALDTMGSPRIRRHDPPGGHLLYEATLAHKDGRDVEVEVLAKPIDERRDRYVAIVRDISARKRELDELEAARRQVAQSEKLAALGSLVSGLAHEIRTPLAILENHLSLVESRIARALTAPESARGHLIELPGHLAAAHDGVDRINRLVKDLRRFLRMEVSERRPARLDEIVNEALRLHEAAHGGRVRIRRELAPTDAVPLDVMQVQQLVLNLVENATEAAAPEAHVLVRTRRGQQGCAELLVTDQGVGIPAEVQARMYEPFFSTKEEGSGLGLAIVRSVVESHGGTITCESAPGRGTTFCVRLPP